MTISSEVRKAGPFSGNGSATSFPFDFKIFSASDLAVYLTDPSGAESVLGGSDYTVRMNADQESAPGGTVVKTTPLAAGYALTITSKLPYLQPVRLTNQGGFYPEVINTALDRLTVFAQQLAEQVERAVKIKISDPITPEQLLDGIKADTAAAKGAAAAAAGSASAAGASESAAAGHVQTAQAAASNAQQQAQAAHGSAEVARQAVGTIVNVGGVTPEQADAKYAPLLNPRFAKQDSSQHGGAIRLQAADNQRFGDLTIEHRANWLLMHTTRKSDGKTVGVQIDYDTLSDAAGLIDLLGLATQQQAGRMSAYDKGVLDWLAGTIAPEVAAPGQVAFFARQNTPTGWLVANGAAVSRTAYTNLFAAIGTLYGAGDGSTTFNLPDLRGEFIRGWDAGRGVDSGRTLGSYQGDAIRNISGVLSGVGGAEIFDGASGAFSVANVGHARVSVVEGSSGVYNDVVFNAERVVTTAAENRPRNVALLPCIKY